METTEKFRIMVGDKIHTLVVLSSGKIAWIGPKSGPKFEYTLKKESIEKLGTELKIPEYPDTLTYPEFLELASGHEHLSKINWDAFFGLSAN